MATKKKPAAKKAPPARKAAPAKKATAPKKMGRPSLFSQQLADTICRRLAEGESLRAICIGETMPSRGTVNVWLALHKDFQHQYARARELQADHYAAEVIEIADRVLPAVKRTVKGAGKRKSVEEQHGDAVERSRLMMDARKWYASKLAPKKYGEKLAVGGAEDLPPIQTAAALTDDQLAQIAAGKRADA